LKGVRFITNDYLSDVGTGGKKERKICVRTDLHYFSNMTVAYVKVPNTRNVIQIMPMDSSFVGRVFMSISIYRPECPLFCFPLTSCPSLADQICLPSAAVSWPRVYTRRGHVFIRTETQPAVCRLAEASVCSVALLKLVLCSAVSGRVRYSLKFVFNSLFV
jgi:hypothetical protein